MGERSGKSRDPVREGDIQDEAGPSAPKRAKPTTHESGALFLDDKTLFEVATQLARDWQKLAVAELKFDEKTVDTIENDFKDDTIKQGRVLLRKWKQKQSTSVEEQITTLSTALKNIGRADIARFLLNEFPTLLLKMDVTSKEMKIARLTSKLWEILADLNELAGPRYTLLHLSTFLSSCFGVSVKVETGSVIVVVHIMSREGLNKLWSMYTTKELAKKLTEILITDELTTEDKSDLAIQATIPQSDYDQACRFFDELEEDQRKAKADSSGMMKVDKQLGESSTATTASSSDPAEPAEETLAEKTERLHPATDEKDSSSMIEVEHKQLGESITAKTASSSDSAGHAEERLAEKMERLHTTTEPRLDAKTLSMVATTLAGNWITLAVELGLTFSQIYTIKKSHEHNLIRQGLEMLLKWKHQQSTSVEQQMTTLCTALENIGRADIARFLRRGMSHAEETAESDIYF